MKPSPKIKPNNILRLRLFELHKTGKLTRKGKIALGRLNMAARLAKRLQVTLSPPEWPVDRKTAPASRSEAE